ncbi:MAG: DUF4139 domain-containing protein [Candidatus Altiarchaeales archaeon]|nr:DUF4139 domain-containing protein [Candidatus Altiarchaeales archaeon]
MASKYLLIMAVFLIGVMILIPVLNPPGEDPEGEKVVSTRSAVLKEIGSIITSSRMALPQIIAEAEAQQISSEGAGVEVTVYNQNLGLVKDRRDIQLTSGLNIVEFQDVAAQIDPTSVHFKSITAPDRCIVEEQNYEYDLVSGYKLIEKYLGEAITVEAGNKTYNGKLLSSSGGLILDMGEQGIITLGSYDNIQFPKLPQGLRIKPTLLWHLQNEVPGNHDVEVSYLTSGINWNANYIAVIDSDDKNTDLNGWVTINNNAGASFPDATLKLVAGDIHRVTPEARGGMYEEDVMYASKAAPQFAEESFFEYHLYSLQRKTDLKDKETKQISLFTSSGVPVTKEYIFDGGSSYWYSSSQENKVNVMLKLTNSEENGLGIPMPKGLVRVYKADSSGQLQFIGEDNIDHTPKDEQIRLYIGDAFDITAERNVMESNQISDDTWKQTVKVELANHKDEDIVVTVKERLYCDWEITKTTHDYEKKDAWNVEFKVPVPADGEAALEFTQIYSC